MNIRLADNENVFKECVEYLSGKGIVPIWGTKLFYIKLGVKIVAVAGYNKNFGATLEPFISDGAIYTIELYKFMEGLFVGLGYTAIQTFTDNEVIIKKLMNEEGYRKLNIPKTNLIKEF